MQAHAHVAALLDSTSWRITAPLRAVKNTWVRYKIYLLRKKNKFRKYLFSADRIGFRRCITEKTFNWIFNYLQKRRRQKKIILSLVRRFPQVERRLLALRASFLNKRYQAFLSADNSPSSFRVAPSNSASVDIENSRRRSVEEIIMNIKLELSVVQKDSHERDRHG